MSRSLRGQRGCGRRPTFDPIAKDDFAGAKALAHFAAFAARSAAADHALKRNWVSLFGRPYGAWVLFCKLSQGCVRRGDLPWAIIDGPSGAGEVRRREKFLSPALRRFIQPWVGFAGGRLLQGSVRWSCCSSLRRSLAMKIQMRLPWQRSGYS